MLDACHDGCRVQEGKGCLVGEDEVNSRGGQAAFGVGDLESPRERWREMSSMNVDPGPTGPQETRQQRARRTTLRGWRSEITTGADGAVEVSEQKGGNLHVEGVSELQEGSVETGALRADSGALGGG